MAPCFGIGVGGPRCGFNSEPRKLPARLGPQPQQSKHTHPDPTSTILQLEYPHDIPQKLKVRPRYHRGEADTLDASGSTRRFPRRQHID